MPYRTIILEGATDEAFISEFLSKKYNTRETMVGLKALGFKARKKFIFPDKDFQLTTFIAGSKSEIYSKLITLLNDINNKLIQDVERILVFIDECVFMEITSLTKSWSSDQRKPTLKPHIA